MDDAGDHGQKIEGVFGFQKHGDGVQESGCPAGNFSPMRSILIVLDSLGIGAAPDADRYGDWGADTLGHVFAQTPELALPSLFSMGLGEVLAGGWRADQGLRASYGRMRVASPGKDSMTGHWEMAGVMLKEPFTMYEKLPPQLVEAIEAEAKVQFLGADGRIEDRRELWREHAATGYPILDLAPGESAIEISAHEGMIPRRRLYEIGRVARRHADGHRIGRVIAQPLTGKPAAYANGPGRHEYALVPPRTVLNAISEAGMVVEGIGKIPDLFARSGVTHGHPARRNGEAFEAIERIWDRTHDGLVFANLAEFDRHGHARDVAGYARALAEFDAWLGGFLPKVGREDLLIITADHGNDPAFRGTGHTREELPLLAHYDGLTGPLGTRETLADVAATLSEFFRLKEPWRCGRSFLNFKTLRMGLRR
jgi:phosphopentomutase